MMQIVCLLAVLMPLANCASVRPIDFIQPCPLPVCLPPYLSPPRPACQNQCKTDQDCRGGGPCCNFCGCNTCLGGTRPITEPPPPADPCQTKKCPAGQVCTVETIFCFAAPCPGPIAKCVPDIRVTEVQCPVASCLPFGYNNPGCQDQCQTDQGCGTGGRCCPLCGCSKCFGGTTRVQPPTTRETCAAKQCPYGKACVEQQGRARCVRQPVERPGLCPIAVIKCAFSGNSFCPDRQCTNDSQCPGAQKCCPNCNGCRTCDYTIFY